MKITPLPTLDTNLMEPITRVLAEDPDFDIDGVRVEILMFACPCCGHITPDHRWTDPGDCLKAGCECTPPNYDEWSEEDCAEFNKYVASVIGAEHLLTAHTTSS